MKARIPSLFSFLLVISFMCMTNANAQSKNATHPYSLVIHGGAGTITRASLTPEKEKAYTEKLQQALDSGYVILEKGGTALDAIETAIRILEDSPLFNAGKGAVFTHDGTHELDASIMDGSNLKAGAVAGVKHIQNPVSLARLVMERSQHVMLSGDGAESFAVSQGIQKVDTAYFYDAYRFEQLQKAKASEKIELDHSDSSQGYIPPTHDPDHKFGTVGAVALDQHGNLAAATSTGGMTNKRYGRIGDSPMIGAGTYANNATCAISCTGHGEYFIRYAVAHDVSALMEYQKLSLQQAAEKVILEKLKKAGGAGGLIGVDAKGNVTLTFNTEGMYRAFRTSKGETAVLIYR